MNMTDFRCEKCEKTFESAEGLEQHNQAKHGKVAKKRHINPRIYKKIRNYTIFVLILAVLFFGIYAFVTKKTLPSTTMENHIESRPPSQILNNPLNPRIHRHLLEHVSESQGSRGGVIINYDCKNYDCEPGLIQDLEGFTQGNEYVYVAPYKNMKAKIVVSSLGNQIQMNIFDNTRIDNFMSRR